MPKGTINVPLPRRATVTDSVLQSLRPSAPGLLMLSSTRTGTSCGIVDVHLDGVEPAQVPFALRGSISTPGHDAVGLGRDLQGLAAMPRHSGDLGLNGLKLDGLGLLEIRQHPRPARWCLGSPSGRGNEGGGNGDGDCPRSRLVSIGHGTIRSVSVLETMAVVATLLPR